MRIVYYTSGISGFGRVIIGISIANALKRKNIKCRFTIISSFKGGGLMKDVKHIEVPMENEIELSRENCHNSVIYKRLKKLKPDVLIINHLWFTPYYFINELNCKKIYISDQADDHTFTLELENEVLQFKSNHFHRTIAIEPFKSSIEMESVNPLLPINRDEIPCREDALDDLNLEGNRKLALYGLDGHPYDTDEIRKKYEYLKDEGYDFVYPSNYGSDFYPAARYYNALDFLVYGGGYTQFWEAVYFEKDAVFEPFKLRKSNQADRVKNYGKFHFNENGADQLVDIIMNL